MFRASATVLGKISVLPHTIIMYSASLTMHPQNIGNDTYCVNKRGLHGATFFCGILRYFKTACLLCFYLLPDQTVAPGGGGVIPDRIG